MDNAVYRTAPATLGLLNIQLIELGSKISALLLANIQTGYCAVTTKVGRCESTAATARLAHLSLQRVSGQTSRCAVVPFIGPIIGYVLHHNALHSVEHHTSQCNTP